MSKTLFIRYKKLSSNKFLKKVLVKYNLCAKIVKNGGENGI